MRTPSERFIEIAAYMHHKSGCPQLQKLANCECGLAEIQNDLIEALLALAAPLQTPDATALSERVMCCVLDYMIPDIERPDDGAKVLECTEAIETLLASAGNHQAAPTQTHMCAGCHHRWEGDLKGAELCGDCCRKAQAVLVAAPPQTALSDGEQSSEVTKRGDGAQGVTSSTQMEPPSFVTGSGHSQDAVKPDLLTPHSVLHQSAPPQTAIRELSQRLNRAIEIVDRNLLYPKGQRPLGWTELLAVRADVLAICAETPQEKQVAMIQTLTRLVDEAVGDHPECPSVNNLVSFLMKHNLFVTAQQNPLELCVTKAELTVAAESALAFLRSVEWDDRASETNAADVCAMLRDALEVDPQASAGLPQASKDARQRLRELLIGMKAHLSELTRHDAMPDDMKAEMTNRWMEIYAIVFAVESVDDLIRPETEDPSASAGLPQVGMLRVELWLGQSHHHVIEGPMGFHVDGVAAILRAVQAELDESARIETRLAPPPEPPQRADVLARKVIDLIPESLGMTPDPWPSDKQLESGASVLLRDLTQFFVQELAVAVPPITKEIKMEPMHSVLHDLAANIVEHVVHMKDHLGEGHAAELEVTEIVQSILVATLHDKGFVRIEPVSGK